MTLREEHRLRVLKRMFGPRRDEVQEVSGKLHSEELHKPSSSPVIIWRMKLRRMRWAGHVARIGKT
jgi:hypothetical protein